MFVILFPAVAVLLLAGCATVENGCSGFVGYIPCRAQLDYREELKDCQALETPLARDVCVLQAKRRLQDAPQRALEAFRAGQQAVCGRASGGTVPCGQQVAPPPPAPSSILPTAPDGCLYVMVDGRIHTVCR